MNANQEERREIMSPRSKSQVVRKERTNSRKSSHQESGRQEKGKLVAFASENSAEAVVNAMHNHPAGRDARIIGRATQDHSGMVLLKTEIGGTRILDLPFTEQLPRIC